MGKPKDEQGRLLKLKYLGKFKRLRPPSMYLKIDIGEVYKIYITKGKRFPYEGYVFYNKELSRTIFDRSVWEKI